MASRLRTALMWLLLLSLPLQGFAAATMINCGPNHDRMMAATVAQPAHAHDRLANGSHGEHEMGAADVHHAASSGETNGDAPTVQHLDKLMKFKCSACAACCIGAAMPSPATAFKPFSPALTPEFFVLTTHVGFVTDGPDRPPRLSLV